RDDAPLKTKVHEDHFLLLSEKGGLRIPNMLMPRLMNNHGNFIGSLGNVVRFLASEAENLGVEIYPGFAGDEVLYGDKGEVVGVATGDMGVGRDGHPKDSFTRGMELKGKYTIFAEGARGSLTKQLLAKYDLCANSEPQKFGIGFKELWRIPKEKHKDGLVQHSFGWPLAADTGGGSFLYHFDDDLVSIGFVVHLNYSNPTLSPFDEFQRFKTHPMIAPTLEGGERLSYGARALTEGGWQSVPKLVMPGGALVGCAAGFMNVPRIKGSHNAIVSGILCAEHVAAAIGEGRAHDAVDAYDAAWRASEIGRDLKPVRNVKPLWSKYGTYVGAPLFGLDMWTNELFGFSFFGTLKHGKADYETLKPLS
ncbi:MAG: electron transfer flavoprotein-ubiquinone oxidoreductase, partial [Methylocystis sp.]